jgi:hypothetical protein
LRNSVLGCLTTFLQKALNYEASLDTLIALSAHHYCGLCEPFVNSLS